MNTIYARITGINNGPYLINGRETCLDTITLTSTPDPINDIDEDAHIIETIDIEPSENPEAYDKAIKQAGHENFTWID